MFFALHLIYFVVAVETIEGVVQLTAELHIVELEILYGLLDACFFFAFDLLALDVVDLFEQVAVVLEELFSAVVAFALLSFPLHLVFLVLLVVAVLMPVFFEWRGHVSLHPQAVHHFRCEYFGLGFPQLPGGILLERVNLVPVVFLH